MCQLLYLTNQSLTWTAAKRLALSSRIFNSRSRLCENLQMVKCVQGPFLKHCAGLAILLLSCNDSLSRQQFFFFFLNELVILTLLAYWCHITVKEGESDTDGGSTELFQMFTTASKQQQQQQQCCNHMTSGPDCKVSWQVRRWAALRRLTPPTSAYRAIWLATDSGTSTGICTRIMGTVNRKE